MPPQALQYSTVIVGAHNGTPRCNILSITEAGQELETSFSVPVSRDSAEVAALPGWAKYVAGVVCQFPGAVGGFDAVLASSVPMGGGVSSSAALEVSVYTLLETLTGRAQDKVQKALACQKAEHEFAGMPCGIMDQFVSSLARAGHALLIDCRDLTATNIPLPSSDVTILVINSNVKHQLTGSEYPARRAQCARAAQLMGKKSLREAGAEDLQALKEQCCDPLVLKRAEHVVSEITRTTEAAKCLKEGNLARVGELFYESHRSLSELMEVSCPELDQLVAIAGSVAGVLGARMTGGGFGGCVVTLVRKSSVEDLKKAIKSRYSGNPTFFECHPSDGAAPLPLPGSK
ncbi:hypothetical protein JYU34_013130 [Plutella xylostella]|uniref:Galactokinase n=1 Tax=Plutella xylostella TaxID=51655 RepID=A0ABQ7QCZ9_PLUXY|nr:hypothetical protein JYU34_013130 [Plutella xylostella]